MTRDQVVEWWATSLFGGWGFLGENTALTYFLIGAAIAALVCNKLFSEGCLEELNPLASGFVYLLISAFFVLLWGLIPAIVIPIYAIGVFLYTLNDQICKAKKDVRRKK